MASLTWWTWVWVNSGSWWGTGRPGVLWFMGSQRVRHDWATGLIWSDVQVLLCNLTIQLEIYLIIAIIYMVLHRRWLKSSSIPSSKNSAFSVWRLVKGQVFVIKSRVCAVKAYPKTLRIAAAAAAAKSLQSCLTLWDPIDGSPPGSPVPGILQARTLEWVAMSFSNAWKWIVKVKSLSCVRLLATPWTAAHQTPPSMGFSRQEYWSGVP